jgi:DNA/RNA-binding domain of Phe-tRNA-synthetase-like protein
VNSRAFTVDAAVALHVRPGVLAVDDVQVVAHDPRLDQALAASEPPLREARDLDEFIGAVRGMYRRFGLDPTKTRPSSEALLRRLRKGGTLPRVNSAVDVCNWCSAETQLPYGLYDGDRLEGDVVLRVGREGEAYDGIRKDTVHVAGRLALVDACGPFGNPTSDSARTMVTADTRTLLLVIYAPKSLGPEAVEHALALTAHRVREYCGGAESYRALL